MDITTGLLLTLILSVQLAHLIFSFVVYLQRNKTKVPGDWIIKGEDLVYMHRRNDEKN